MTRLGFCPVCESRGHPFDGQLMLLLGSHGYHVDPAHPKRNPAHPKGFTPHLYRFIEQRGNIVFAKTVCCIDGCDIRLTKLPENRYEFIILESKWKDIDMLVTDWNALTRYKRDKQYII